MTRRATIREDGDAYGVAADLVVQYEGQRRQMRRLGALYDRARAFKPQK
jgi:hypothetical protein